MVRQKCSLIQNLHFQFTIHICIFIKQSSHESISINDFRMTIPWLELFSVIHPPVTYLRWYIFIYISPATCIWVILDFCYQGPNISIHTACHVFNWGLKGNKYNNKNPTMARDLVVGNEALLESYACLGISSFLKLIGISIHVYQFIQTVTKSKFLKIGPFRWSL